MPHEQNSVYINIYTKLLLQYYLLSDVCVLYHLKRMFQCLHNLVIKLILLLAKFDLIPVTSVNILTQKSRCLNSAIFILLNMKCHYSAMILLKNNFDITLTGYHDGTTICDWPAKSDLVHGIICNVVMHKGRDSGQYWSPICMLKRYANLKIIVCFPA